MDVKFLEIALLLIIIDTTKEMQSLCDTFAICNYFCAVYCDNRRAQHNFLNAGDDLHCF